LSTEVGGYLASYIGREALKELVDYIDSVFVKFGAPNNLYRPDEEVVRELQKKAVLANLRFTPYMVRHLGSDNCKKVLSCLRNYLSTKVDILFNTKVERILVKNGVVRGVKLADGREVNAKYVVVAPGRIGASWLRREMERLGIKTYSGVVDIGVRVEVHASITEELTQTVYDPKFIFYSKTFDDKVRTFCFCPNGEVITETYHNVVTVNGHSYANKQTENTNFAILVSTRFEEPLLNPITYTLNIARLANNIAGGKPIIQRLGDLIRGRRSTEERIKRSIIEPTLKDVTPGDLSYVFPYRYLLDIIEMLKALNNVIPGIYSDHTLLYGVELKLYSSRLKLTPELETEVKNLFAIGDGAGVTRGLVQAAASGVLVARNIAKRVESNLFTHAPPNKVTV